MGFKYSRSVRHISIIVLTFFLWTFGGLFDVAYAIKNDQKSTASSKPSQGNRSGEKFQKSIDGIYQALSDTTADTDKKKNRVRGKKAEIETLDVEIKKQFQETEKKLRDEGLPPEILDRHYRFVKHYEDNLQELMNNLDDIDKAKGKGDADAAMERAKAHLEKVKSPKKHKALDPNKLPHRQPEVEKMEPRTSPEQFIEGKEQRANSIEQEPILVASNGPLKSLLNSSIPNPRSLTPELLALANPPTSADLAETIEVQFTPEINAKAQELQNNPVKIYNWVRSNIEYVPTYGSIQGANMCLQTKLCNDFDTASLLIALLRASGIHARYTYGTVEVPIDKVKNWLGGFTDSTAAINLLASAGVPTKGMIDGGQIKYVQMEHMWVEAWINYIPSRGARHKNGQGDTWIRLDASFKQYAYTQGIDIKTAVPFDAQTFVDQIKNSATINEAQGYVTNVNSTLIQQGMQDYQTRVQNYISQNYPNATVGDVLGKKEIVKQEFSYLLGTLPYKTIVRGTTYSSIPDSLRHKLNFSVVKDITDSELGTPINITKSLPELAGKKITLSYSPATAQDEAAINSFLPKPHADGSPIQPNELPTSLPAYLVNLKPELRLDGAVVATGTPLTMGSNETFTMTFTGPKVSPDVITNPVKAGNYLGIALDLAIVSQDQMQTLKTKLEATKANLEAQNFTGLTKDDILGDLLYTTALSYHAEVGITKQIAAKTMGIVAITQPSETIFSCEMKSNFAFGIPLSVSPGGLAMDADRLLTLAKALDGNKDQPVQFFLSQGSTSSALEHSVPEQLFSAPDNPAQGISAVKALKLANDQGIPIYTINQTNISIVLPQLQLDSGTVADIQNAVNAGMLVTAPKTYITFNGWTVCGYIIGDPVTGAGAYMISGGMNGAYALAAIAVQLFVLTIVMAASSLTLGGPAGVAAAALAIGFFALAMTTIYYEIAYLGGKEKADEFFLCLLEIVGVHYLGDGVLHILGKIGLILLKGMTTVLLLAEGVYKFGTCMEGLKK